MTPAVCERHGRPVRLAQRFKEIGGGLMQPIDEWYCAVCADATRGPDWRFGD